MLETLKQDIRYALRGLKANPGFTTGVVLTVALGIGANAAMFGIVDRMLFRPPPFMIEPATVHRLYSKQVNRGTERTGNLGNQYAQYRDVVNWTSSFSIIAGFTTPKLAVGVGDAAREMQIGVVSASFFKLFDAPPAAGRYFLPAEDSTPSGEKVTILSYATWQLAYGGRKDALGQTVQIGPAIYTIVGVTPKEFVGLWPGTPPAYFIPLTTYGAGQATGNGFLSGKTNWWQTYHWG